MTEAIPAFYAFYIALNLTPNQRIQALADAQHLMQIAQTGAAFGETDLDAAAERLSASAYIKTKDRSPLVMDAVAGGAFAPITAGFFGSYTKVGGEMFVTQGIDLMARVIHTTAEAGYSEKDRHEIAGDVASASSLCRMIGGFDKQAEMKRDFRECGLDFAMFDKAMRGSDALRRETAAYLQKIDL